MKDCQKQYSPKTIAASGSFLLTSLMSMILAPSTTMAACVDSSISTSATGGSTCNTSWGSYDGPFTTLSASGLGSMLNVNGLTSVRVTANNAYAISADNRGKINVTVGTSPVIINTLGSGSAGIYGNNNSEIVIGGDVKIRTADGANGIVAYNGANITTGLVDIYTNGFAYTYSIVADGANSQVTITGGNIVEKDVNDPSRTSNSVLRAGGDGNGNGSTINVNGYLSITTEGFGARGVYASNDGTINLTDTDITISSGSASLVSTAMQVGKSRPNGTGSGTVNSTGTLNIYQNITSAPGMYIEGASSRINANSATSSTMINAAGTAIIFGGSSDSNDSDTRAVISLNNAVISTRNNALDLIKVGGRVVTGSALNLTNGSATAGTGGWLINVTDQVITDKFIVSALTKASDFTFNADNMALKGSVNTVTGSKLNMTLNNGSVWTMAPRGSTFTSTLTNLTLNSSTLDASNGNFNVIGNITNNGVINLSGSGVGNQMTIKGNYTGSGGLLVLNSVLGDDGSLTDRLILDGGAANGNTRILVNNQGGVGALTSNDGIMLVNVINGASSTPTAFRLNSRLVVGAYDYSLYQGGIGVNANDGNWYLRSLKQLDPDSQPLPRPETGVYLSNLEAASTMFMHTLHDRLGEPQFTDLYQGDGNTPASWVRIASSHADGQSGNRQIDINTDTSLIHFGGEIARWSNNKDRWHFGLMGGYGKSDIDADPKYQSSDNLYRSASGSVEGYSIGAYATWYRNQDKPTGPYVDLWTQYGWYDNKVKGYSLPEEKYNSNNWTVSIEGGYAFIARDDTSRQWMIEPQAQFIYNKYSADDHKEGNGTWVHNGTTDGIVTRLGARFYSRNKQNDNGMQPFVETNWWNSNINNTLTFDNDIVGSDAPDNRLELKVGLQGEIAKNWQMWGHVGGQWGENNYNRYEGLIGVKRIF